MNQDRRACPLCGAPLPTECSSGCEGCFLGPTCGMACCPACGYTWVEPEHSTVGRFLEKWLRGGEHRSARPLPASLKEVPVGWKARLHSWDKTPPARRQQLRAFGLTESGWMHILQQTPMTIIRVDRTELALERDLAATILVEAAQPDAPQPDHNSA